MLRALRPLALALAVLAIAAPATAQQPDEEVVPLPTAPVPMSAMLRNAGYTLTPEEAAYLDADEQAGEAFMTGIMTVDLLAAYSTDEAAREIILRELRRVASLDPAGPATPPPSLSELHRLGVARRTAVRDAAQRWLEGLEAGDPAWVNRGAQAYGTARQAEADWYAALRQRLGVAGAGNP